MSDPISDQVRTLFESNGHSLYGGEGVTQLEHALQAAMLAEIEGASPSLIVAALVHDIGHLLHDLPDDAPDHGVDDVHEVLADNWLRRHFGPDVTEPVRMHVDAKRYLCATEPEYEATLSPASLQSLELQGGKLSGDESREFERNEFFEDGIRLRRWDDLAKVIGLDTPSLEHFLSYIPQVLRAATVEASS